MGLSEFETEPVSGLEERLVALEEPAFEIWGVANGLLQAAPSVRLAGNDRERLSERCARAMRRATEAGQLDVEKRSEEGGAS